MTALDSLWRELAKAEAAFNAARGGGADRDTKRRLWTKVEKAHAVFSKAQEEQGERCPTCGRLYPYEPPE